MFPVTRLRTTRAPSFLSAAMRGCLAPGRRGRVHRTGRLLRMGGRRLDADRQHGRERPSTSRSDRAGDQGGIVNARTRPRRRGRGAGSRSSRRGAQRRHDDRHHVVGHHARPEPSPSSVSLTAPAVATQHVARHMLAYRCAEQISVPESSQMHRLDLTELVTSVDSLRLHYGDRQLQPTDGRHECRLLTPPRTATTESSSVAGGCPGSRRNLSGGPPVPSAPVGSVRGV